MKKGQRYSGYVRELEFPNKGIVEVVDAENGAVETVTVKNALPGQTVSFLVKKKRGGRCEGRLLEVEQHAACEAEVPAREVCPLRGVCGGCLYQGYPYEETLRIKEAQIKKLLAGYVTDAVYDGITASPAVTGYRNKMEYTFGDACRGGELMLGLHKRGSYYDICDASDCQIAGEDFGRIVAYTRDFFRERGVPYYHRMRHDGILRHLLVRGTARTGELLIALVAATGETAGAESSEDGRQRWRSQRSELLAAWRDGLLALELDGRIAGILYIENDSPADTITCERMELLYGQEQLTEEVLGLRFQISPFSFFQTNSLGAERLYALVREYVSAGASGSERYTSSLGEGAPIPSDRAGGVIYDLYSGTGTIAQLIAPAARRVIGVEIVEEAVQAARANASANGLKNCEFIAGDVLRVLEEIEERPDGIVLDPPRDGVHPKALRQILGYGVPRMVYISCKPTSLARDMEAIAAAGYRIERWGMVDMFPWTGNVETVVLLSKLSSAKHHIEINVDMDELDLTSAEAKATYEEIRNWV